MDTVDYVAYSVGKLMMEVIPGLEKLKTVQGGRLKKEILGFYNLYSMPG